MGGPDRQNVKETILGLVDDRGKVASADLQSATGLTRQAVHYHLKALVAAGMLERTGRGRGVTYARPNRRSERYAPAGLEEHRVWEELLASDDRLRDLPTNALAIHRYAFTEMLNNAIDHSRGTVIDVSWWAIDQGVSFEVDDDGIGAFRSVRETYDLPDDFAAIQQIAKGKTTTDPKRHTGEGIFFTSKAVDHFVLQANGLLWHVDNLRSDVAVGVSALRRGTRVMWTVLSDTSRRLNAIFDAFTDDDFAFSKSRTTVRLARMSDDFVSRSEAKRLSQGLERFKEVTLDFEGVNAVGQGFVDELLRVWAGAHPEVKLVPVNMSDPVRAMITRGLR